MTTDGEPHGAVKLILGDRVLGVDHVGICVAEMDESTALWSELTGVAVAHREAVTSQRTETAFLDFPDGRAAVELISPLAGNEGLTRFLSKRGPGLHHVAFAVRDLAGALARLEAAGIPLIDRAPRPGARGHQVAFLHPRAAAGTLVELVERPTDARSSG